VGIGSPAGEVAAAMAGTSRRKKKKKEKKKSKWEMVQRQTESNNATTTTTRVQTEFVRNEFVLCGHEVYQLTTTPLKSNRR
jgi:phage terminase Nu1 subunit (DNA packaging protein)